MPILANLNNDNRIRLDIRVPTRKYEPIIFSYTSDPSLLEISLIQKLLSMTDFLPEFGQYTRDHNDTDTCEILLLENVK